MPHFPHHTETETEMMSSHHTETETGAEVKLVKFARTTENPDVSTGMPTCPTTKYELCEHNAAVAYVDLQDGTGPSCYCSTQTDTYQFSALLPISASESD